MQTSPPFPEPSVGAAPGLCADRRIRRVAQLQGAFYLLSGVWPVIHLRSFLAVTGPKTDTWLVQTVGLLLAVIGTALLAAARQRIQFAWVLLGALSALVLALVDVVFVTRHVISPIYLADAAVETVLVAAWAWAALRREADRENARG